MEKMSREQMVAEFGAPGVENPMILDLITTDPDSGDVVLVMIERRPWGAHPQQLKQIEEKINRYMAYALDGFLAEHHPAVRRPARFGCGWIAPKRRPARSSVSWRRRSTRRTSTAWSSWFRSRPRDQTGTLRGFLGPPATTPLGKAQLRQRARLMRALPRPPR